jgi:hypothetical protein
VTRESSTGPHSLPPGTTVEAASARGASLVSPTPVPKGAVLEFDLLLGARPLQLMARVVECRTLGPSRHALETEFLAMAQADRDSLADFIQAVGCTSLGVRPRRAE